MNEIQDTAANLATIIKQNTAPEFLTADRGDFQKADVAIIPVGMELHSLKPFVDEYREKPDRRTGTITADTLASFVSITNRFKADNSVVFGRSKVSDNSIEATLTTIFNYHPETPENTEAKFADHKALYGFPISKDFRFWLNSNRKVMDQLDFALFLEERLMDMVAVTDTDRQVIDGLRPTFADPLKILELARDLELYSKETFKSKNKLSSGETELKFTSEHVDSSGKPITIPDFFVISVPLFAGGDLQRLLVRLRYRLKDGSVVWSYDLYRIDRALEEAFDSACATVTDDTKLPLFVGAPEQPTSR